MNKKFALLAAVLGVAFAAPAIAEEAEADHSTEIKAETTAAKTEKKLEKAEEAAPAAGGEEEVETEEEAQ